MAATAWEAICGLEEALDDLKNRQGGNREAGQDTGEGRRPKAIHTGCDAHRVRSAQVMPPLYDSVWGLEAWYLASGAGAWVSPWGRLTYAEDTCHV